MKEEIPPEENKDFLGMPVVTSRVDDIPGNPTWDQIFTIANNNIPQGTKNMFNPPTRKSYKPTQPDPPSKGKTAEEIIDQYHRDGHARTPISMQPVTYITPKKLTELLEEYANQRVQEYEAAIKQFVDYSERIYEVVGRDYLNVAEAVEKRFADLKASKPAPTVQVGENKYRMPSPITGKSMKLRHDIADYEKDGIKFKAIHIHWLDEDNGEVFTDEDQETINLKLLHWELAAKKQD